MRRLRTLVTVAVGCFLLLGASHGPAASSTNSWSHPALPATGPVGTTSSAAPSCVYDEVAGPRFHAHGSTGAGAVGPAAPSVDGTAAFERPRVAVWNSLRLIGPRIATEAAASAGSTGRAVAGNLTEQLAMKEVVSSPAGTQIANIVMKDARWPAADGWVKMTQRVNGIEVHYVRNTITGAVDDFKFPLPTPGGG